jgi:hypothetical protein
MIGNSLHFKDECFMDEDRYQVEVDGETLSICPGHFEVVIDLVEWVIEYAPKLRVATQRIILSRMIPPVPLTEFKPPNV